MTYWMTEARLEEIAAEMQRRLDDGGCGEDSQAELLAEVRRAREAEARLREELQAVNLGAEDLERRRKDARSEALKEAVEVARCEVAKCERLAEIERTWTSRNPGYTARDVEDHTASESGWRIRSAAAARIADAISEFADAPREPAKVRSVETLIDYQGGDERGLPSPGFVRLAAGEYRVSLDREIAISDLKVELYAESDSGLTTTITATGRAGDKWLYVVGIKDANGVGTDHRFHLQLLGDFVEPGVWTRVPGAPAALSPELQALAETSDRLRAALRSDDEIQVESQLLLNAAHDVLIAATAGGTPRSPSGLAYEAILHTAFNLIDAIKNFREALRTDGRWNELGPAEGALVRALEAAEKGRP